MYSSLPTVKAGIRQFLVKKWRVNKRKYHKGMCSSNARISTYAQKKKRKEYNMITDSIMKILFFIQ